MQHHRLFRLFRSGFALGLLLLLISVAGAQGGVRAVVVNEFLNVRITPAIGADVIATVPAGTEFAIVTGRSADGEWLRVDYLGNEGWINLAPLVVLEGNLDALPVADPRSIPYGGFEAPRSGPSGQLGPVSGRATNGVRLRAGPSTGYPTLANVFVNQGVSLTGRNRAGTWYQVNYEGTLGWVSAAYIEILSGDVNALPVDGIVADAPPLSGEGQDDFLALLRLMLDRVRLAQDSLGQIRTQWTDAALNGRAICQSYPPRPSDIQIAQPLLAAYFVTLDPLQRDFNDAMFNTRLAIDLFIEVCNQPGTGNPVGSATVTGALEAVNLAEAQFGSLTDRLLGLLPGEGPGPNECLIEYQGRAEVLPVIRLGAIYLEELSGRKRVVGYCFDALQGMTLNLQVLPLPDSNIAPFASISPLIDPTNFVSVQRVSSRSRLIVPNIQIGRTARYVLILADLGEDERVAEGTIAFRLTDVTFAPVIPLLVYDGETDSVILSTDPQALADAGLGPPPGQAPDQQVQCPSLSFTCQQLTSCGEAEACLAAGNFSLDPDNNGIPCEENLCIGTGPQPPDVVCPSTAFTCNQLFTCGEAEACLAAGNFSLDPDNDGIPCEDTLCPAN